MRAYIGTFLVGNSFGEDLLRSVIAVVRLRGFKLWYDLLHRG
jgi:hypothetical protein